MKQVKCQSYVYQLVDKITKNFYFGYRSNNKLPAEKDLGYYYFSSSSVISKKTFHNYEYFILEEFTDPADAYKEEQRLIYENWNNPRLLINPVSIIKKCLETNPGILLQKNSN